MFLSLSTIRISVSFTCNTMIPLSHKLITLLLLCLTVHLNKVRAGPCSDQNITHVLENNTLTIYFSSNELLKMDRKIQCSAQANWTDVNGCSHVCTNLVYGEHFVASIELRKSGGFFISCTIEGDLTLQPPLLDSFSVINDQIHLTVRPPLGSYDYFTVRCLDGFALNSTSRQPIMVNCSVLPNVALTNILLETGKNGYPTVISSIDREVPLPIPFNYTFDGLLLTLFAENLPDITLLSTYEFMLGFYVEELQTVYCEQQKVIGLTPDFNATFRYGLLPNMSYVVTLKHTAPSVGYAENSARFLPISDKPYPYEITDLHVREEFGSIWVRWNDSHQVEAPVEFVLVCNSRTNVELRLGRDTAYVCQQMTFKLTDSITVYTRVAIPGYTHPRSPSVSVDVRPVSDLPEITVSSRTENSITIKWDYASMAAVSNSAMYHIQCDTNQAQILINIQSNEYQCTSLSSGTLHIISMKVSNAESTAERVKSIQTNTLLAKSKYNTHFYPSDTNRVRSVIIEWTPPQGDIETVQVICPSSSVTFERNQLMPTMFVKCSVTSGEPYRVIFLTTKSGYETATFEFTDTAPIDPITTISTPTTPPTTARTTTTTTTPGPDPPPKTTTTTTTISSGPAGTTTTTTTTTQSGPAIGSCQTCCLDKDDQISRWKIVAITGLILAGFFLLAAICLLILSVSLHSRR